MNLRVQLTLYLVGVGILAGAVAVGGIVLASVLKKARK